MPNVRTMSLLAGLMFGAATLRNPVVLKDSAVRPLQPARLASCAGSPPFPAELLANPLVAPAGDLQAWFKPLVEDHGPIGSLQLYDPDRVLVLDRSPTTIWMLIGTRSHLPTDEPAVLTLGLRGSQWSVTSFASSCRPRVVTGTTSSAPWVVDHRRSSGKRLVLIVGGSICATGKGKPLYDVELAEDTSTVDIRLTPRGQMCMFPSDFVEIRLSRPIGSRRLFDAGAIPSGNVPKFR